MRIDLALKSLCLVKTRSIAKSLCEHGRILIDGRPVRPSHRVEAGQRITIRFRARTVTVELMQVPPKQLSKAAAVDYYRRVETPPPEAPAAPEEEDWRDL
jgi:ribosomal 50S subunit-recycling heat shock protein